MGGETQPHLGVICVCRCSGRFRALPGDFTIAGICNCLSDSEKYFVPLILVASARAEEDYQLWMNIP